MTFFLFLQTLATSQGNILENKDLIESLNQTKASSALIQESLAESHRLQSSLDKVEESCNLLLLFFFPAKNSHLLYREDINIQRNIRSATY